MELGLDGKTAVVTGASRGIGRSTALALAEEGCNVAVGARSEDELDAVADAIEGKGVGALSVPGDLSTKSGVTHLVERTLETFGTVNVLVNNVGGIGRFASFDELSDEEWMELYELNVMSMVRATRAVLAEMKDDGWGRIINISSESGSQPDPEMPHYNATKAAIKNLTKSLSKEYGDEGIRINTVSPAFVKATPVNEMIEERARGEGVDTDEAEQQLLEEFRPHIEVGRAGEPEDVAKMVVFLASEAADFLHGGDYRVDGGSVASMVG